MRSTRSKAPNQFVSLEQAALYLDVTIKTLRRRIADGSLPAYRLGPRLVRVSLADLDALLTRLPSVTR